MAKKKRTAGGAVDFNMTPMIDVTFQLIIFFIIAGQMSSDDIKALIPPEPYRSLAVDLRAQPAVIVNIVSLAGNDRNAPDEDAREASMWYVKGHKIPVGNLEELVKAINMVLAGMSEEARSTPRIEIRCDRRIRYSDVQTVLLAARDAGIADMKITAVVDEDK